MPPLYVAWLKSFFTNRQARVRFNGELSMSRKIPQGLPQGSVLSPVLFLLYINRRSIEYPRDVSCFMYADDVSVLASAGTAREAENRAQAAVSAVASWSKRWKLSLNTSKSEV
ncbi:MAG: reverse transcriptase domain-containing protein, partial [Bacteroidota bacterium]